MKLDTVALITLTTLVMIAFATNSVLNRMAVEGMFIDPGSFALIRVVSGAVVLSMILTVRGGGMSMRARPRLVGALSLSLYMVGFSLAYLTLDAGLGALILFGTVQLTMFAHAARNNGGLGSRRMIGAAVAFVGLTFALWPGGGVSADFGGALLMVAAGVGWAIYTIAGRRESDAMGATAANFLIATPFLALLLIGGGTDVTFTGAGLAILSGAVTSGLGYALWYSILPRLETSVAAVVQLSVPVIAIIGGVVLLGEELNIQIILSAIIVLGGIAIAITSSPVPMDRRAAQAPDRTPKG
jgi:drug/metabolite transporter (DMT)-like permease